MVWIGLFARSEMGWIVCMDGIGLEGLVCTARKGVDSLPEQAWIGWGCLHGKDGLGLVSLLGVER
jgi:hypothetical protein